MTQSKMLKDDILKILAKELSGGSNTRPAFESAKSPNTFFGGKDNQPYYPSAQEPAPAANPAAPIVPGIVVLEPGQKSGKRPTYKSLPPKNVKKQKKELKPFVMKKRKQKRNEHPLRIIFLLKIIFLKILVLL